MAEARWRRVKGRGVGSGRSLKGARSLIEMLDGEGGEQEEGSPG